MTFKDYFLSLNKQARIDYAKRAGTSANYISGHLIHRYKTPRRGLMKKLSKESNGAVSLEEMAIFFFTE